MTSKNHEQYARWLRLNSVTGSAVLAAIAIGVPFSAMVCLLWVATSYLALMLAIVPSMQVADWLSGSRVLLSILALISTGVGAAPWLVPVLFALAMITDLLDGNVARRSGETWHGARLDMEADQLLVLMLSVSVMEQTALGALVLVLPGLKYLFTILTEAAQIPVGEVKPVAGNNRRAQLIFVYVICALFINLPVFSPGPVADAILLLALLLLCGSFFSDWFHQWRQTWT
ncbi:MAG: CDP-alcohol phosphatidyltransferase family protein [Pseudomonadota bacterium]